MLDHAGPRQLRTKDLASAGYIVPMSSRMPKHRSLPWPLAVATVVLDLSDAQLLEAALVGDERPDLGAAPGAIMLSFASKSCVVHLRRFAVVRGGRGGSGEYGDRLLRLSKRRRYDSAVVVVKVKISVRADARCRCTFVASSS